MKFDSRQMTLILASLIKQYGDGNLLKVIDQQLKNPIQVRLHPVAEDAILVLLEGQKQIDEWEQSLKDASPTEEPDGIPVSEGKPNGKTK